MENIKINSMQRVPEPSNEDNDSLDNMTVIDLKDICRACGLSTGGIKKDLVTRLSELIELLAAHNDDTIAELLEECDV